MTPFFINEVRDKEVGTRENKNVDKIQTLPQTPNNSITWFCICLSIFSYMNKTRETQTFKKTAIET